MKKGTPNNVSGREMRRAWFRSEVRGLVRGSRGTIKRRQASQYLQAIGLSWREGPDLEVPDEEA